MPRYYNTKDEVLSLGNIDPEFEAYFSKQQQPQSSSSDGNNDADASGHSHGHGHATVQARRKFAAENLNRFLSRTANVQDSVTKIKTTFEVPDGSALEAVIYRPEPVPATGCPLIVNFHGGGFCVASPESDEATCRSFSRNLGAVCVSIGYRLAPEHKFPTATEDAWEGLKFAAAHAARWGAEPATKGFIVAGTSAGGNLAALLAHRARDDANFHPRLTGQFLSCPWLCPRDRMPAKYDHLFCSYEQNVSAPFLPRETLDMYEEAYRPDHVDDRFNIISYSKGHANLPPAYIIVCGADPFRDEDLIYEKILREENGIDTRLDVYPGMPHGYWQFCPDFTSSLYKPREDMLAGVKWLLEH